MAAYIYIYNIITLFACVSDFIGRGTTTGISLSLPQEMTGRRLQKTVWLLTKLLVILQ